MSAKVLIVDDDPEVCQQLSFFLETNGYETRSLLGSENLVENINQYDPELLLLDFNIPKINGIECVEELRRNINHQLLPVIMVSGTSREETKVQALDTGVDDYVIKPFAVEELLARVRAVLRRKSRQQGDLHQKVLKAEGLRLDLKKHRAFVDDSEVALTFTEFRLLTELIRFRGEVLSRQRLCELALGKLNVTDRTIDVHMASLRKKIKPYGRHIQTVRGVGYRFA